MPGNRMVNVGHNIAFNLNIPWLKYSIKPLLGPKINVLQKIDNFLKTSYHKW